MAKSYQYAAELRWTVSRRLWPAECDGDFDQVLDINRTFLDEFAVELDACMPDELRKFRKNTEKEREQAAMMNGDTNSSHEEEDGPSDEGEAGQHDCGEDSPSDGFLPSDPGAVTHDASGAEGWEDVEGGSDDRSLNDARVKPILAQWDGIISTEQPGSIE